MEGNDWKQDPRLAQMDPAKLKYLNDFAGRIRSLPKNQVMPALLSMQREAAASGIRFSDAETAVLISVLSAGMSPADKKRMEMLKFFAKKLSS